MLSSPLPEEMQARNWSTDDVHGEILRTRMALDFQSACDPGFEATRILISRLTGLRIIKNLKEGKVWNDSFRR